MLQRWTGNRWAVIVTNDCDSQTIYEKRDAAKLALHEEAAQHPLIQAALKAFPKAKIVDVKTEEEKAAVALTEALPEVEDEWDPFEE
jgi:DNA polymerase-3 subunit gamma/tau